MSYETFGNFGGGKHVDEVISAAKKQKMAGEVAHAIVSPISYAVKTGANVISGKGNPVSDEQYIKAIILKVMREHDLIGDGRFKNKLRSMIKEILLEEDVVSVHPHWNNPVLKKNGYKEK